jgi:hypothetical protein
MSRHRDRTCDSNQTLFPMILSAQAQVEYRESRYAKNTVDMRGTKQWQLIMIWL